MVQRQLYTLLTKLQSGVDDRDELGTLVSYAVLHSLLDFSSTSNSKEEIMFSQVKAVYAGLEHAVQQSLKRAGFSVMCELTDKVNKVITKADRDGAASYSYPSPLLNSALYHLTHRRGSHEDILRRIGLRMFKEIRNRGAVQGNTRRLLTKDFQVMAAYFAHQEDGHD